MLTQENRSPGPGAVTVNCSCIYANVHFINFFLKRLLIKGAVSRHFSQIQALGTGNQIERNIKNKHLYS